MPKIAAIFNGESCSPMSNKLLPARFSRMVIKATLAQCRTTIEVQKCKNNEWSCRWRRPVDQGIRLLAMYKAGIPGRTSSTCQRGNEIGRFESVASVDMLHFQEGRTQLAEHQCWRGTMSFVAPGV